MVQYFIWFYVFSSIFASAIFMKAINDFISLAMGILLLVSALVVYSKRKDIEKWVNDRNKP